MYNDIEALRRVLESHGFATAASAIKAADVYRIDHAIRSWQNYPRCMDVYPMHLRGSRKIV